ncbi:hypothetical protein KPH14_004425 [Odynerus spinipes]|uniref:FAM21/CAPZIP domain-containing protein n=1 Tax=Odynerus spinipes TaxID=1348599 RepID=A0AAD9S082_9HYME|nr:hypothetical protein KPH14_004425 [Odynerus spinipes]
MNTSSLRNDRSGVEQQTEISSAALDDVFENEDLFGPPPLPKTDPKAAKSKVSSLFDDSDSGDELFSTTSSGSRSQKSTDVLATTPQYLEKNKFSNRRGLFDEDIDIFGNKDSPDVDIFGTVPKPYKDNSIGAKRVPEISSDSLSADKTRSTNLSRDSSTVKLASAKSTLKKSSLFDDDDDDDDDEEEQAKNDKDGDGVDEDDLFAVKKIKVQSKVEPPIFANDTESDLFSTKQLSSKVEPVAVKNLSDATEFVRKVDDVKPKTSPPKELSEERSNDVLSVNGQPPLFEDDDDYEDLFAKKSENKVKAESKQEKSEELEAKHETGPIASKKEELAQADVGNSTNNDLENKKHPPTTLNIRAATSSPPDDNSQAPRRAVSGKIKDLMGKMGDLKILSPTDTPPLWRKSEEKTDEEDEVIDRDSDDGGCISTQARTSSIEENEPPTSVPKQSPRTTSNGNSETAISFDIPAQVETLSTAASKSRVRIQAKRRPQSRHARKSALRQSGIDFDTVDAAENIPQEEGSDPSKESSNSTTLGVASNVDRLVASSSTNLADNISRNVDPNVSIADDKSELGSISKESSMSANKNTLLSPSTDEEDLFDVPPDLPEDPQREDALFGRAPILSPIQSVLADREPTYGRPLRDTIIGGNDDNEDRGTQKEPTRSEISSRTSTNSIAETNLNFDVSDEKLGKLETRSDESMQQTEVRAKRSEGFEGNDETGKDTSDLFEEGNSKAPLDPLRDNSYDPLKDPSQLFAFVTKTPSPDKGKDLLFSDDDSSLFSSSSSKTRGEESGRKRVPDLFADDSGGDFFSVSLTKSTKKPLKDTKISFFDSKEEDGQKDEEDSLFRPITKKVSVKSDEQKAPVVPTKTPRRKINIFQDDDEDDDVNNLFAEQPVQVSKSELAKVSRLSGKDETTSSGDKSVKTSKLSDIFGDQSSTEDDIFTSIKPVSKKVVATKPLFVEDSDDDDSEIFGKSSSLIESKANESRPIAKKSVTRDLKKTAEKIVEDPLSIFQDD